MKKWFTIISLALVTLLSCSKASQDDPLKDPSSPDFPYDSLVELVVTVKQAPDGTVYFQLSDSERLYPGDDFPFTGECRAMTALTIYAEEVPEYGHRAEVAWLEPLDKGAFFVYPAINAQEDWIDVNFRSGITSVMDGYLTIHYNAWWGEEGNRHEIYLVQGEDPYELTLVHSAKEDSKDQYLEGFIYFDINSLPDTGDSTHTVKLNWTNTLGQAASAEFEFKTRT